MTRTTVFCRFEILQRQREVQNHDVALCNTGTRDRRNRTGKHATSNDGAGTEPAFFKNTARVAPSAFDAASRIAPSTSSSSNFGSMDMLTLSRQHQGQKRTTEPFTKHRALRWFAQAANPIRTGAKGLAAAPLATLQPLPHGPTDVG